MTMTIGTSTQTVNLFHQRIEQKKERGILEILKNFFNYFTKDEPKSLDKIEDRRVIAKNMVKLYAEGIKSDPYLTLQGFQATLSHALITCPRLNGRSVENLNKTVETVIQSIKNELAANKSLAQNVRVSEDRVETPQIDQLDIEVAEKIRTIEQNLYEARFGFEIGRSEDENRVVELTLAERFEIDPSELDEDEFQQFLAELGKVSSESLDSSSL